MLQFRLFFCLFYILNNRHKFKSIRLQFCIMICITWYFLKLCLKNVIYLVTKSWHVLRFFTTYSNTKNVTFDFFFANLLGNIWTLCICASVIGGLIVPSSFSGSCLNQPLTAAAQQLQQVQNDFCGSDLFTWRNKVNRFD